jgi:hypothetical protein
MQWMNAGEMLAFVGVRAWHHFILAALYCDISTKFPTGRKNHELLTETIAEVTEYKFESATVHIQVESILAERMFKRRGATRDHT